MESLLILLAIVGLEAVAAWVKKRGTQNKVPKDLPDEDPEIFDPEADSETSSEEVFDAPPSLQDLIRKFHEEQTKLDGEDLSEEDLPEEEVAEIPDATPEPQSVIPQKEPFTATWNVSQGENPVGELVPEVQTESAVDAVSDKPQSIQSNAAPILTFNRREAAKGILWARVLEDPRYKRRSPFPFTAVRR